jgi:hypothetical protein
MVMAFFELDHEAHGLAALRAGGCLVSLEPRRLAAYLAQHATHGTAFGSAQPLRASS